MPEPEPTPRLVARSRHDRETARADRRWFILTLGGAGAFLAIIFGARALYHVIGPYPQVTLFMRRVRRMARWVIPRWRRGRKW